MKQITGSKEIIKQMSRKEIACYNCKTAVFSVVTQLNKKVYRDGHWI